MSWIEVNPTSRFNLFKTAFKINDNELLVIDCNQIIINKTLATREELIDGAESIAYNKSEHIFYISANNSLYEWRVNDNSWSSLTENMLRERKSLIFHDNKIHFFQGMEDYRDTQHFIYDLKEKKEILIHRFDFKNIACNAILCLAKQNKILFVGHDSQDEKALFHEYSFKDTKWSKLNMIYPDHVRSSKVVVNANERYIIYLGGKVKQRMELNRQYRFSWIVYPWIDKISVYDTKTKSLFESCVKAPNCLSYSSCITGIAMDNAELITFGFIRDCYKGDGFRYIQTLPHYMITLLSQYVTMEEIHLLARPGGIHWKISLDEILKQKQ